MKNRENIEIEKVVHKSPSKKGLEWNGIYSWLRRADVRGIADIITHIGGLYSLIIILCVT